MDIEMSRRKKRERTSYTQSQIERLEDLFSRETWPNRATKEQLAFQIGLPVGRVNVWFQNHRAKMKKAENRSNVGCFMYGEPENSYASQNEAQNTEPECTASDTNLHVLEEKQVSGESLSAIISQPMKLLIKPIDPVERIDTMQENSLSVPSTNKKLPPNLSATVRLFSFLLSSAKPEHKFLCKLDVITALLVY